MKIAIRDDDLCFYSDYASFRSIYNSLGVPVSASVVPFAVPNHGNSFPYGNYPRDVLRAVSDNALLISLARKDIEDGNLEILQHGYSHEYLRKENKWIPEMIWKDESRLKEEVAAGKNELENAFGQPIRVFVAPSQEIGPKGIHAIELAGLDYSGFPYRFKDRSFEKRHLRNTFYRYFSRLLYGLPMGRFVYKRHVEIPAVPLLDLPEMERLYHCCKRHDLDMVVVVHYWKLLNEQKIRLWLTQFVEFVKSQGEHFSFVGDCFTC